mmetsp:Transcript_86193/g.278979  ORF Transcript_86193/g.278979 Transcript_86193/m.278979 type:complete len:395 (-) Transcript_86193:1420-2604(-)
MSVKGMLMPGSSSVSAFRRLTADLLVTPSCMSGWSSAKSSSSSMSTVSFTISDSLLCTASVLRAVMSSLWPVSTRAALFFTACSGCAWGASCCSCWPWSWAACCCCHCSNWYCCHCCSDHCSCGSSSSSGPVMCSTMPLATHSPRASPCSRKIVRALLAVASALLVLPLTSSTSASMHITEAMFRWSSSSTKAAMASSVALKALSQSSAAVWICATVHMAEAMSFLLPAFLAMAAASSAHSAASAQSAANAWSKRASGISPWPWPCTSISSRICATRKAAAASPSPLAASVTSFRALSAARNAASYSLAAVCTSAITRSASASSCKASRSWKIACASRATATASTNSCCMKCALHFSNRATASFFLSPASSQSLCSSSAASMALWNSLLCRCTS